MQNLGKFLLSFDGRLSRRGFLLGYALPFCLPILASFLLMGGLSYPGTAALQTGLLMVPYLALVAWPGSALYSRRFHDSGLSARWAVGLNLALTLSFAATFGAFYQLFEALHHNSATTEPLHDSLRYSLIGLIVICVLSAAALIYLGWIAPGQKGPNQYGPDPLSGEA